MQQRTAVRRATTLAVPLPVDGTLSWAVLRDADADAGPQGEVDLLAAPEHLPALRTVLSEAGYVEVPSWGRGSHTFFRRYDAGSDQWCTLDVVTELAFGAQQQFATDLAGACLRRTLSDEGVPVLQDTDAFWALLLHVLLDKGGVPGRHEPRLRELARTCEHSPDWAGLLLALPGAPDPARLRAAASGDVPALIGCAAQLRSAWLRGRPWPALRRLAQAQGARAGTKLRVARRRPGATVALLGPDGAGKSTLAAHLATTLPLPVRQVYAGHYQSTSSTRPIGWALAQRVLRQVLTGMSSEWHVRRGRVTVFDRYAYDAALDRPGAGTKTRIRRALLARVSFPPDLVVVLDAEGRTLWQRSGEHSAALLERQRSGYLALAAQLRQSVVVDASRPADDVRREVTDIVWRRCTDRWRAS